MFIVHLQKFEIHGLLNSTFKTNKFNFDPSAVFLPHQTDDGLTTDQDISPEKGGIQLN